MPALGGECVQDGAWESTQPRGPQHAHLLRTQVFPHAGSPRAQHNAAPRSAATSAAAPRYDGFNAVAFCRRTSGFWLARSAAAPRATPPAVVLRPPRCALPSPPLLLPAARPERVGGTAGDLQLRAADPLSPAAARARRAAEGEVLHCREPPRRQLHGAVGGLNNEPPHHAAVCVRCARAVAGDRARGAVTA
jgi:hypothetical protein